MSDNGTSRQSVMETPLLHSIFTHLGEGVMVVDKEGQIIQVNPAASRILGADVGHRTLREALQSFECFSQDQVTQYGAEQLPLSRAQRGEHVVEELMFVRHAGRREGMWLCVTATPVLDDDRQPAGAVALFRDVSEQREAQSRATRLKAELERRVEERNEELQRTDRELRLAQARYADMYNFAPDMFFSLRASTGAILECNEMTVRKLGYTRDELVGRPISEILDPDSRDVWRLTLVRFRETGANNEVEMRFRCKDRTAIDVSLNTSAIRDDDGRIIATRSICRDITQRKQVEQELTASRERLQNLIDDIDAVLWERDATTLKFTFISPHVEDMLGFARERWLAEEKFWLKILHPDDREFALSYCLKHAKLGADYTFEYRVRAAGGREVWLRDIVRTVKNKSGQVTHLRGVFVDVTAQKHAEQSLRQSEEYFRQLVDALPEMLWMAGLDKRCTFFNKQWLDFSGRTMEQELGDGWTERVHPDDLQRCLHIYNSSFDTREPFSMEYRLRRHDGEVRWIDNSAIPWFGAGGEFAGFVGSCVDVTDRLLAEEQVRKQRRELAFVGRVATMGEMTAGLAHELNQPLSAIASYTEGLKIRATAGHVDSETLIDVMEKVGASAQRAGEIIRRLRKLIRKREAPSEPLDVNEQIQEVVQFTERDAYHAETQVELRLSPELPKATGDSIELQQVLVNLIRNGIEAMSDTDPTRRRLRIDSSVIGSEVCVTVSDAGTGIPQDELQHLFDAFYTTKEDGLGMGLAISRSIIESHGGKIWATSTDQGGAEFHFTLPVARGVRPRE